MHTRAHACMCTHAHMHIRTQHLPSPFGLPADVTRCAHTELVAAVGNALSYSEAQLPAEMVIRPEQAVFVPISHIIAAPSQ